MKIWYLLLFISLSLIPVAQWLYWENSASEGYYFSPPGDIAIFLSMMKSYEFNFQNPWGRGDVFTHPALVSSHFFVPYGFVMSLIGINAIDAYIIFLFISSIILCFSLYYFADTFSINKKYFIFFAFFVAGIGGWLTLFGLLGKGQFVGYGFSFMRMLGEYRAIAFSFSVLAVSFAKRKKFWTSSLFLIMSAFIHPAFGIAGIIIFYFITKNRFKIKVKYLLIPLLTIFIEVFPWLNYQTTLKNNVKLNSIFLPSIIISLLIPLYFVYIKNKSIINNFFTSFRWKKTILFLWIISFIAISYYEYSSSFWTNYYGYSYYDIGEVGFLLAIPFLLMLAWVTFKTYFENRKFLFLFLLFLFLILLPLGFTSRWFAYLMLFASAEASLYFPKINKKFIVIILCVLLSLPSIYFYYDYETNTRVFSNRECYYTNMEKYNGTLSLKPCEGMKVPYLFGKRYLGNINRIDLQG